MSMHTQSKRKPQHSHTSEVTTAQRLLSAAALADRSNSSSSSTQQQRRCGSEGGQLRASEPPIVLLVTPCLGGCVLTYASARGVHAQKSKRKFQHSHTTEATTVTAQRLLAEAADRPNRSSSSTQQGRRRGSRVDHLRASEPPTV